MTSVYRLNLGKQSYANFFKRGALCPMLNLVSSRLKHVHSIYNMCTYVAHHLCTVSTDYTRVNVYVHSAYKLCTVIQTMHTVYIYAQCLQTILG